MVFEVVAACIHTVGNMDVDSEACCRGGAMQSLGFEKKISSMVPGAERGSVGAVGSRCVCGSADTSSDACPRVRDHSGHSSSHALAQPGRTGWPEVVLSAFYVPRQRRSGLLRTDANPRAAQRLRRVHGALRVGDA